MKFAIQIGSALAALALLPPVTSAATDDLTKPVQVSRDGRFLAQPDGAPFFWLADTAWPLFVRLDRDEVDRYFKDRAAKGYTVVQALITGEPWDTWLPNRNGDVAFLGGDPRQPNPKYFEHVDWVVDRAAQYGVRLALLPTWGGSTIAGHFENPKLLSQWGYDFNWDSRRNYEAIDAEYRSEPTRPVVDGEPHYEGIPHDGGKPGWTAYDVRNSAYHALFAGAAGHTFGSNSGHQLFDPARRKPYSHAKSPWWVELDSPGSRQMLHVKALFLSRPYFTRIPDQTVIRASSGVGSNRVSATRDHDGTYLMVYAPRGEPVEVDLSKISGTAAVAWWFDPRTGEATRIAGEIASNRQHTFMPPSSGPEMDWVLVVDDAGQKFGPPVRGLSPTTDVEHMRVTTASHVRHLPFEGAANFRDLGGYTAAQGKRVRWGSLYRSDALDSLTAPDMKLLARLNIARITDFRSRGEIAKRPDRLPAELEVQYVHVPLEDPLASAGPRRAKEVATASAELRKAFASTNDEEKVATIDRLLVDHYYPRFVRDSRAAYSRWVHDLLDVPKGSAHLFHCTGGADRTGFAAAILLLALGVSKEQVLEDYLLTNSYFFSPRGLELFAGKGLPAMPSGYRLQARYLEASFKAMENDYGSIDDYLRQGLGIDDEMMRELRARYLE